MTHSPVSCSISLDYTLPTGALGPYFDALAEGRALASRCTCCGHVAFPARTRCAHCVDASVDRVALPGTARLLFRTDGPGGSFALVRFDGADTNTTVALAPTDRTTPPSSGTSPARGRLTQPQGERPGLWLILDTGIADTPEPDDDKHDDER